ncbi:MAG: NAD-dependent protein deacylase [Thermotogota bacterium]
MKKYYKAKKLIESSHNIVVLSGAGISTNTGIPDFRGKNGIYNKADIENPELIFDYYYFKDHPELFYKFHKTFLNYVENAEPTYSYKKLKDLEDEQKLAGIITQNIDSLHKIAGNKKVYEIHGGLYQNFCLNCGREYDYDEVKYKMNKDIVAKCDSCGGVIKPDIVFFGEMIKDMDESIKLIKNSDLLLILGSSLMVTPAAFLPAYSDADIIIINKGEFSRSYLKEEKIKFVFDEDIDSVFKKIFK